ncbi:MAG: hypothetical protein HC843_13710 [Sphingomonadales bacterium]|nr:hypothetical protein [Sphingomonadales bacterium]
MLEQSHAMFVGTTGSGKCDGPGAMAFGKRICTRAIPLMASN